MIVHVVLMHLRDDVAADELERLAANVQDLAESIAGRGSCVIGTNVTEEPLSQGYEFGFAVRFADRAALATYHADAAHEEVSRVIEALSRSVLVFDFAA
ncbi:MAG: Dabb family protein [Chloroflexia bacterium]|nr:Dabb family protein [Chloroflexia bacterium]